jgi:hypothetical protein
MDGYSYLFRTRQQNPSKETTMPIELLPIGPPVTLLANVAYALPAVRVTLFTDAAAPTITQSMTAAFTANSAVTLTGGQASLSGGFIKATANTVVTLKRD